MGLVVLGLILMIPKEVWIALIWISVLCGSAWLVWGLVHSPSGKQTHSRQDEQIVSSDNEKTLAEIINESARPAPQRATHPNEPPAHRSSPASLVQPQRLGPSSPIAPPRTDQIHTRPVPTVELVRVREPSLPTIDTSATKIRQLAAPRWIPFGETVTIQGQEIRGGGYYFGTPRHYEDVWASNVDPTLRYSTQPDWRGDSLDYWPRYKALNEHERGAFLAFLNSDRSAPTVGIGYVFLYFYGLEHRLLRGLPRNDASREEGKQILGEIQRLQRHYGWNNSFRRYSNELLATAQLALEITDSDAQATASGYWTLADQLALGRAIAARQPLSIDLAFLWARVLTDEARSSTWDVVLSELKLRFGQLYRMRYPDGLQVPAGRSKLTVNYRWASPGGGWETIKTDIPDVTRTVAPVRPLIGLLQQALGELGALRRVRRSKNRTALGELAAMPESLRAEQVPDTFKPLVAHLGTLLTEAPHARIQTAKVLDGCDLGHVAKVGKREATTLVQALEALGYGMEPDVRFLGQPPSVTGEVVVFRLSHAASRSPSPAYAAALLLIQAALAVASSGDEISEAELLAASRAIEEQFALSDSERERLEAHILWLHVSSPTIARLEGRVKLLPAPQREAFAGVLVDIAVADGHISPAEARIIERFYRALGLDPFRVHADLHHASLGTRHRPTSTGVPTVLDADVIAEKLAETARVQSVLAQIFMDETPVTPTETSVAVSTDTQAQPVQRLVAGLDRDHVGLMESVLGMEGEQWARSEFESACEALGLMPDGALEMLNEASFTMSGETLLEGDDPLYINDYARIEIQAALAKTDQELV